VALDRPAVEDGIVDDAECALAAADGAESRPSRSRGER